MSINEFPAKFGKYILLDRLNAGGMAEVFRAKVVGVEGFERLVAIKCMLPALLHDESFSNMFIDEARLAAQVGHANVAQIYELGRHAERLYIAMELVNGRDLRHIIKTANASGKHLPPEFAAYVCSKVAEGLDFAHRKLGNDGRPLGLVHRDISPQNVLVSYDGEVKVVDFGIAKANSAARDTQTQVGVLKGKFAYMSPEQVLGQDIDRRADIFALGSVLYELVTGGRLFTGESDLTVLERVREGMLPDLNLALPADATRLIPVFEQALQVDPEKRYGWASEMAEALEPMLMGEKNIFGPKRAAALMREMFAPEVADLAEKLKRYAQVNESNCLVTIGESATHPSIEQRVFESTFANRAAPAAGDGDTGIVPAHRNATVQPQPQPAEPSVTAPQRPAPRPAAVQPKLVVPKPAPRAAPTPGPSVAAPASHAPQPTTTVPMARAAGPMEPTVVPAGRSRLGPLFEPSAPPPGRASVAPSFVSSGAQPPLPPRSPASQAYARSRSQVQPPVRSAHSVGRRLTWVTALACAVTGSLVLVVNASMPEPMTLQKSFEQLLSLHPVAYAEDGLSKLRHSRLWDRWLFGSARPEGQGASARGPGALSVASQTAPADALGPTDGAAGQVAQGFVRVTVLGAESARVFVDGIEAGEAPLEPLALPVGEHTVRVVRRRADGSSEHRESHVRIEARHAQGDPMGLTLTF